MRCRQPLWLCRFKEGAREKQLLGLRHDVDSALHFAEAHGLKIDPPLTTQDRQSLHRLSAWHVESALRYPEVRSYVIPRPVLVRELVDRLLRASYVAIWGEARYRHDRDTKKALGLSIDPAAAFGT
jgi:hypothetical protein